MAQQGRARWAKNRSRVVVIRRRGASMQGGAPMAAPMDEIFPDEAVEAFAKLNLASAVSSYFKGSGRYMESDIAFRQAQRYRALGFHVVIARNQQRISDAMNGQGLAYHESVIKEIATAR